MKKYLPILALGVIFFGLVMLKEIRSGGSSPLVTVPNSSANAQAALPPSSSNSSAGSGSSGNSGSSGSSSSGSTYKDGTYTGSVADAYYGNVQVQATISGGKITDVTFLQYPNDNGTSMYINSQAMPLLKQEAIAAQSANVDGVSGASETSPAFQQSLASALNQAH